MNPKLPSHSSVRSFVFVFLLVTALGLVAALVESVQASGVRGEKSVRSDGKARVPAPEIALPGRGDVEADPRISDVRARLGDADSSRYRLRVRHGRTGDRVTALRLLDGIPLLPDRAVVFDYDRSGRFIRRRGSRDEAKSPSVGRAASELWKEPAISGKQPSSWRGRAERVWWWPSENVLPIAAWRTVEGGVYVIRKAEGGKVLARRPAGHRMDEGAIP